MNNNIFRPLVSVIVITYNSSKYVIDTLESIANQTYSNIELIISDDCSSDDTIRKCREWIQVRNGDKLFTNINITTTKINSGICVNYNNGLEVAHGEWIKYIAGDDMLTPDCISSFVEAIREGNEKIMICGTYHFQNNDNQLSPRILNSVLFAGDARSQERVMVRKGTIIEGPTLFLHRETLIELGGFEEKYPFIEDYPLCMKFLAHGYRIKLLPKHLIRYRVYPESVSRSDDRFTKSIFDAIEDYAIPAAWRNHQYIYWWHEKVRNWIRHKSVSKLMAYILVATDLIHFKQKWQKN